jgi:hypothetical protein
VEVVKDIHFDIELLLFLSPGSTNKSMKKK